MDTCTYKYGRVLQTFAALIIEMTPRPIASSVSFKMSHLLLPTKKCFNFFSLQQKVLLDNCELLDMSPFSLLLSKL